MTRPTEPSATDNFPIGRIRGPRLRRRQQRWLVRGLVGLAVLVLVAGGLTVLTRRGGSSALRGDPLSPPIPLPASTVSGALTTDTGGTTSLAQLQSSHLLLVYFGYTHCPDVCPTTMADLGAALRASPARVRDNVEVAFVTSDPARDTPKTMHAWLSNFDQQLPHPFIGLTSSIAHIDATAKAMNIFLAPPVTRADGEITVDHSAEVLAFNSGQASTVWTAGTPIADYVHDLNILARPAADAAAAP